MSRNTGTSSKTNARSSTQWLRGILALVLVAGLFALALEASTLDFHPKTRRVASFNRPSDAQNLLRHRQEVTERYTGSRTENTPQNVTILLENLVELQKASKASASELVTPQDLHHLSLLHKTCVTHKNAIVSWEFGAPGQNQDDEAHNLSTLVNEDDANLLEKLKQCPDVDLFLPSEARNNGYCEDAMAYAKYLKTRLLPLWALTKEIYDPERGRKVDYFDLCPRTPMLFFQHYWADIPSSPRWPRHKKTYLMPNIEMYELDQSHYWRVDVVLCKTRICEERVNKWYEQQGNPQNAQVIYTKHTSSDPASYARHVLGDQVEPKNFSDVRFIHTAGSSYWKGTQEVIHCWLSQPHFPPLDLYIHDWAYRGLFHGEFDRLIPNDRIRLTTDEIDPSTFGKVVAESAYFLCPSQLEGYGHYINQARASGGVVITTGLDPMTELIQNNDTGLIVPSRRRHSSRIFLGGRSPKRFGLRHVRGMIAEFNHKNLCSTVEHLLDDFTIEQRREMGEKARLQYHKDTKFFEQAMIALRILARHHAVTDDDDIEILSSEPLK